MLFVEKILYTIIKRNIFMMDDLNLSKYLHPLLLFSEYYYQLSIIMTIRCRYLVPLNEETSHITSSITQPIKLKLGILL